MAKIKTERMELRLTPLEKEKLTEQATKARMSMSEYLLSLSEQKKIFVAEGIPELCKQIVKVGTNINQIALVANTCKSISQKQIDIVNENMIRIQALLGTLLDTIKNSDDEIEV